MAQRKVVAPKAEIPMPAAESEEQLNTEVALAEADLLFQWVEHISDTASNGGNVQNAVILLKRQIGEWRTKHGISSK